MKHNIVLFAFACSAAVASTSIADQTKVVNLSLYTLHADRLVTLEGSSFPKTNIELFNGAISTPQEIVPPIRLGRPSNEGEPIIWAPPADSTVTDWILVIKNLPELEVTAVPFEQSGSPDSKLLVANISDLDLFGLVNDQKVVLPSNGSISLGRKASMDIRLKSGNTAHGLAAYISELDEEGRYLLLVAPPHVSGSAMLSHRLLLLSPSQ